MENNLYKELYELEEKHWWFIGKKQIVLSMLKKYMENNEENRILDAGCGSGLMLNAMKRFGIPYGMDYSEEAIKYCKLLFHGDVRQGWLPNNVPYPKNYFNAILALDVLEHIEDDLESIIAIRDSLSDNGICVITVPAFMFLWSNHDRVHQHKRRYVLKELKQKLLDAGFKIEKISYYNTLLFLPIFTVRMINKFLMKGERGSDAYMQNRVLNYILKIIFTLEKYILKHINMRFGVSIMTVVRKL